MIPPEKELEWDAWERRNPGVAHPDRVVYRNQKGRERYLDDWVDPLRLTREPETFAERARRSRMGM
jgi:hypothetical protein